MAPHETEEDVDAEPPTSIDPYKVLEIKSDATADQVKKAYRKQALKHHPDKAAPKEKENANKKFQEIAFAYAILSDERRRRRYDTTGSTAESLDIDEDEFDWVDFFREQFTNVVNEEALDKMKKEYQGSDEERTDILDAFSVAEGNLDEVYEQIIFSNPLNDDERFRSILDQAIDAGEVEGYAVYIKETDKSKKRRMRKAEKEAAEAQTLKEEIKDKDKSKKGKKRAASANDGDMGSLMAMIQKKHKADASSFLDHLEAKYGGGKKPLSPDEEPSEEAFQQNAKRMRSSTKKASRSSRKPRRAKT